MSGQGQAGQYWMNVTADGVLFPVNDMGSSSTTGTFIENYATTVITHITINATGASDALINIRRQNEIPGTSDSVAVISLLIPANTEPGTTVRLGHSGVAFFAGDSEAASGPTDLGFAGTSGLWSVQRGGAGASSLEFTVFFRRYTFNG